MMADDDEDEMGGLYENGHWIWDDNSDQLMFVSDRPPENVEQTEFPTKLRTGAIHFREDVDLIEQLKYRRRYQRKLKPGQPDVITVQDAKDVAIYTAPLNILTPALINMLHLPTTEKFIKALIFCMAYYVQVSEEMAQRMLDLETKVRSPLSDVIEHEFTDNLNDLRVLVAKEYCTVLLGAGDMKNYHHMGPSKKRRSLPDKDARQFETLLRMCVQIVWLALGRRAFNIIELEINRLFKTEIYNAVEHSLKTGYIAKMSREEKRVLLGPCVKNDKKLNTRSPLINEVNCERDLDYRMMGIGLFKLENITPRLRYMHAVIAAPEEKLSQLGITLGIVGMERSHFDTMLKPVPVASSPSASKKSGHSLSSVKSSMSKQSTKSTKSTLSCLKPYPEIHIPLKSEFDNYLPPSFPTDTEAPRPCSEIQRRRWLNRLNRLRNPLGKRQ